MAAYLKIENPGVAPSEAFTLLGASTKRASENGQTIGKFGSGNKHGVAVMLRHRLNPVVFAGNLKLEFGTRSQGVDTGISQHQFERVFVKYGGKDAQGVNRSSTEDLGFVLEYGATDWLGVDLALREFISNSIDRAIDEGEHAFASQFCQNKTSEFVAAAKQRGTEENAEWLEAMKTYRESATDYKNVVVEVVNDSQVRAKAGFTRVFIPLSQEVFLFYNNLGKWFLHFSEPESLKLTILPKKDRNFDGRQAAVIYRRGVRVREFTSSDVPSLFDYNLESLQLDESRKVDDWNVLYHASEALSRGDESNIIRLWQSFLDDQIVDKVYWEHSFNSYGLESGLSRSKEVWASAFQKVAGENAVVSTKKGGEMAARKGFKVIEVPESFVAVAEKTGILTPSKVLTQDDREGRDIFDATPDADAAVDFAWDVVTKYNVANGRTRPAVKTFRKIMEGGSQTLGFYRDNTVFINQDIAGHGSLTLGWHGMSQQLLVTAMEEVTHHVTGSVDGARDFQDFLLNLTVYMAKEIAKVD